jgi:hypothetical protein
MLAVIGIAGCGGSAAPSAAIRVIPAVGLWDQARTITISRVKPGSVVTVTTRSPRPTGLWIARASFRADRAGVVDLARVAPVSGSYQGVSAMGLVWWARRS